MLALSQKIFLSVADYSEIPFLTFFRWFFAKIFWIKLIFFNNSKCSCCLSDIFCAKVPLKQGSASVEEIKVVLFHIFGEISVWLKLKRQRRRLLNRQLKKPVMLLLRK